MTSKQEKPRNNYEEVYKEVQSKEEELSILTGKINESIRNQVQIETEANGLLLDWRRLAKGKKATKCLEEIEKINVRDAEEHEKFDRLRKEKNEKQQELRLDILFLLKNPPKDENKRKLEHTELQKSSLISGTTKSNIDDVDFSRIFKKFVINEEQYPIEINIWKDPTKSKKNTKENKNKTKKRYDPDSKLSSEDPYYGKIYKGKAMGKDVCVKIIYNLELKQFDDLRRYYEKMRNIASHPNLLPPIAGTSQNEEEPKILVDLAEGPYRSLEDFLKAPNREEKIGFLTKLKYAKEICGAMAWLHGIGKDVYHLRLKPSNILFTKDWKIKIADYGLDLPIVPNSPEGWIKSGHAFFYPPELLVDPTRKTYAVDSYSFGLVLYTLLTETFPYTKAIELKKHIAGLNVNLEKLKKDAKSPTADQKKKITDLRNQIKELTENDLKREESKTIKELLKQIEENPVQLDAKIFPTKIVELIKRCTSQNPEHRPKFADLTEGNSLWLDIYQEMVSAGNEKGQEIWNTAAKDKKTNTIPWDEFAPVLWKRLGFESSSPENLQVDCVKTMLYLENNNVTHKNWNRFLDWFAPLRTGKDGKDFLARVVRLLEAHWFYGLEIDRTSSDAVINQVLKDKSIMDKNKGKSPFLVRIAASQGDKFCLVYYKLGPDRRPESGKIEHVIIEPKKDLVDIDIFKYITDKTITLNLFLPKTLENRFFDTKIFKPHILLESKDMTKSHGEEQFRSVVQPNSVVGKTKYI